MTSPPTGACTAGRIASRSCAATRMARSSRVTGATKASPVRKAASRASARARARCRPAARGRTAYASTSRMARRCVPTIPTSSSRPRNAPSLSSRSAQQHRRKPCPSRTSRGTLELRALPWHPIQRALGKRQTLEAPRARSEVGTEVRTGTNESCVGTAFESLLLIYDMIGFLKTGFRFRHLMCTAPLL